MGREDSGTLKKVVGLGLGLLALGRVTVDIIMDILLGVVHGNGDIGNMKVRSERESVSVAVAVRGRGA